MGEKEGIRDEVETMSEVLRLAQTVTRENLHNSR